MGLFLAASLALVIAQAGDLSTTAPELRSCHDPSLSAPIPLTQPAAQFYPPQAVRMGEEGAAIVSFVIDETGKTNTPTIRQSSGYADLDAASIETAKTHVYNPATLAGKPVACRNEMRIVWKLTDDEREMSGINVRDMGPDDYPATAKTNKEEGITVLVVLIDENGKISNSAVMKSSGYGDLDAAALDWMYKQHDIAPARFAGKPVKTSLIFFIRWSLGMPQD